MELFQDWLDELANAIGLDDELRLDEHGQCFLLFDELMLVQICIIEEDGMFSFASKLGNIDEAKIDLLYPRLLEANLLWRETNGATLAVQQYSEMVMLVQHMPVKNCDYNLFEKALEVFVNTVEFWLKHLKELQIETTKPKGRILESESAMHV